MRQTLFLALTVVALCPACATMATQANLARSATTLSSHSPAPVRRVFTTRVTSGDAAHRDRPVLEPTVSGSVAWGTVRIVVNDDDTFEYLATIYNPRGETFTGAFLRRGDGEDGGAVLATLFSDMTLRSQYIQLRGTVSVARDARAGVLAEEIREHPRDFAVSVHTANSPRVGAIRGTIE